MLIRALFLCDVAKRPRKVRSSGGQGRLAWSGGAIDFGGGAIGVEWRINRYWRTEPAVEDGSNLKRVKRGS